jgi:prepilin-type N-terminal cleavage/methylation domain-containing protein
MLARRSGFSIIELFVVLSLLAIFMSAVHESVIVGLRTVSSADQRETIRQQLASTFERFIRDASTADDVDDAATNDFQFDTLTATNVQYLYDSGAGTLSRDDNATSQQILLRNLTSFDFNYFDTSGTQLSEPVASSAEDTIRVVEVTATVTLSNETITVSDAAFLRNL